MVWDVLDGAASNPWGFLQWDADDPEAQDVRITDAVDVLAPLCDAIGEEGELVLASRRYAMSGDHRALQGTVL
ncbi:hypothetical protein [Streptomyces sp. NBC_01334]|uniref:hypothetical protein n=1 Tax=Streptomyces sp. NBC_01334 TaxID=2903827 RepID=UPI002E0E822B|nr:hypothetical protein OG736_43765 [Streptomyces sp. NBC_01334]